MEENFSDTENMVQTEVEEDDNGNDSDDRNKYNDYSDGGLISSFCQLDGNEYFVEISEEFLKNRANLYGIPKQFKHFK
jgi:Casein kinase II regulatory subunit